MRLHNHFAAFFLCLLLAGCSSNEFSKSSSKTITLDTKGVPENLTVYINEKPQTQKTNNDKIKLSVPKGQVNVIKVKNEKPLINYQVELPQDNQDSVSLTIDPMANDELTRQAADLLNNYYKAINNKKNALSYLSKDSILNPKNIYKDSYKSVTLHTSSYKTTTFENKPELIVLVDAVNRGTPSYTRTYQFRLLWEKEEWKIFHQQVLYEVFEGKLVNENEKGTYPGEKSSGPHDLVLSF